MPTDDRERVCREIAERHSGLAYYCTHHQPCDHCENALDGFREAFDAGRADAGNKYVEMEAKVAYAEEKISLLEGELKASEDGTGFTNAVEQIEAHHKAIENGLRERLAEVERERDEWKNAIIDAAVVDWVYTKEHETNPRKAVGDLLARQAKIALDPAVSKEAHDLRERLAKAVEVLVLQVHNEYREYGPCFCCPAPAEGEPDEHQSHCVAARALLSDLARAKGGE